MSISKNMGLLLVVILSFMLLSPVILATSELSEPSEKIGVLLIGIGEPEKYDADMYVGWKNFLNNYMESGMKMMKMPFISSITEKAFTVMDSGTLLVDRKDIFATEPKKDPDLMDAWGNSYTGKDYKWISKPFTAIFGSMPMVGEMMPQFSYYLAPDGPGKGEPDLWEYINLGMYDMYQKMDNHNPGEERELKILDEIEAKLKENYGDRIVIARGFGAARPGFPDFRIAAERLVREENVKNLILAEVYIVFSEFEHPAGEIPEYLEERGLNVNIIVSGQIGGTDAYNRGVAQKVEEELMKISDDRDVVIMLNHHGMPCSNMFLYDFGKEPYHQYANIAFEGAKKEICNLDIVKNWNGRVDVWKTYAEMAEGSMDPDKEILSVGEAADKAVEEGYDYCIDIPYEVGNSGYETLIGLREGGWGLESPAWKEYYIGDLKRYRTEFEYEGMKVVITDGWIEGCAEGCYHQISAAVEEFVRILA